MDDSLWDAEARRIKRAFGLKGESGFKLWYDSARQFQLNGDSLVPLDSGVKLYIAYEGVRKFTLWFDDDLDSYIGIDFNGKVRGQIFVGRYAGLLARGLFHLELLSPEIEAALKLSVSAHEKTEWTIEYEKGDEL